MQTLVTQSKRQSTPAIIRSVTPSSWADIARHLLVLLLLALPSFSSFAAEASDFNCMDCHSDEALSGANAAGVKVSLFIDGAKFTNSIHGTQSCQSCHNDIKSTHPTDNVHAKQVDCARCHAASSQSFEQSPHAKALKAGKAAPTCVHCHGSHQVQLPASPASPLYSSNLVKTCGRCHSQALKDVQQSVHGKASSVARSDAPTCIACHVEHPTQQQDGRSALAISRDVCGKCHALERLNTRYRMPPDRVKTFFDSYHGLAVQKGSTTAANCSSCHGFHKVLPSTDPDSTIHKDHLVETCGKCHPGASGNFAQARVHVDLTRASANPDAGQRINGWVRKIYIGLIFAVVGAMFLHNLLLLRKKLAARARLHPRTVERMDFTQRVQHTLLAVSFFVLCWTGFALKFPDSWIGQFLISNELVRSGVHRAAAVALVAVGLWHLIYRLATRQGRRLSKDMAPGLKDLRDATGTLSYLAGARPAKPQVGRFSYAEKIEYWAVVWGILIMGATGAAIWFKIPVTHWLPRWVIDLASTIHYYEAILASLAIVVWHFYHVIFDPSVYPLNMACVDGRASSEWLHEEHPLDATATSEPAGSKPPPATKPPVT